MNSFEIIKERLRLDKFGVEKGITDKQGIDWLHEQMIISILALETRFTALLTSLPEPARTELAAKLGVE